MKYRYAVLNKQEFPIDPKQISVAIQKASEFQDDKRDVRDLMSLLERAMSSVPKMSRHKLRRMAHISAAEWTITAHDEENELAVQMAKDASQRLQKVIKKYTKSYVEGELFGASVQRLGWYPSEYGLKPRIEYSYKPYEIERNEDYSKEVSILVQSKNNGFQRAEIPDNEIQNFIVFVPDNPEPGGILRTVIFDCFMIVLAKQEWLMFIQFLKGIIQAKVKLGATPQDKAAAVEAVKETVKNKAAVTTDLVEFLWEKMNNEASGKAFKEFLEACEETLEIAITNTTMMATDKERNALTVLERGEIDLSREMRMGFEEILNDQLLKADYYMNVDKSVYGIEPPYSFKFSKEKSEDKIANAGVLLEAINSGLPIKVKTWNEKTGIELDMEPDLTISLSVANDLTDALKDEA